MENWIYLRAIKDAIDETINVFADMHLKVQKTKTLYRAKGVVVIKIKTTAAPAGFDFSKTEMLIEKKIKEVFVTKKNIYKTIYCFQKVSIVADTDAVFGLPLTYVDLVLKQTPEHAQVVKTNPNY